ncbi:MAG: transketolase [Oscillospiraceae bacterium]|nr:transketolase [Oscillospiraceae bacterium]
MENLKAKAYALRRDTVDIIMAGGGGHIGGDMSAMEILTELYFCQMNVSPETAEDRDRDYFIMSKGHSMEAYYAVLCAKGFLDLADVRDRFSKYNSPYIGHPHNTLPGIEMNSGSLGHGLPVSVGLALAARMDGRRSRVYVVTGDGELAEGSNWEGFMSGAMYKLDNLCCVIDRNRLQISGGTEDVMALDDLKAKVAAFGWNVIDVADGNDIDQLHAAFEQARQCKGKPSCVIANTVKGKGSPVMENQAVWHHKLPSREEYEQIMADLEAKREALA